jgi:hypothetical protein
MLFLAGEYLHKNVYGAATWGPIKTKLTFSDREMNNASNHATLQ